jgi:hypothetical protein
MRTQTFVKRTHIKAPADEVFAHRTTADDVTAHRHSHGGLPMRILVTGASGLIGSALVPSSPPVVTGSRAWFGRSRVRGSLPFGGTPRRELSLVMSWRGTTP